MDVILNGFKFGVVLTFLVGPVFFTILQTSVERGFWTGVLVVLGVSLSDILYVVICFYGLATMMADSDFRTYLSYVGGIILIGFGLYHLVIKSRRQQSTEQGPLVERRPIQYVVKGFLINGMSPTVLFFWIGAASIATINYGYDQTGDFALFFGTVLTTVLATDIAKAYLAGRLRALVTRRSLMIINVILGVALILFGGRLILGAYSTSIS